MASKDFLDEFSNRLQAAKKEFQKLKHDFYSKKEGHEADSALQEKLKNFNPNSNGC